MHLATSISLFCRGVVKKPEHAWFWVVQYNGKGQKSMTVHERFAYIDEPPAFFGSYPT